jgi:hypothetical protein
MWMRNWRKNLQSDSRALVFTEEKQKGKIWVYAICRSSRACDSLFADLQQ